MVVHAARAHINISEFSLEIYLNHPSTPKCKAYEPLLEFEDHAKTRSLTIKSHMDVATQRITTKI